MGAWRIGVPVPPKMWGAEPPTPEDREVTLVEHLEELRRSIIVCLIAWGSTTAVAFVFNQRLIAILEGPLRLALRHTHSPFGQDVVVTTPLQGLAIPFEVAAVAGVILALPVIVWQTWHFIAPGLRSTERQLAFPFVGGTLFFFALGGTRVVSGSTNPDRRSNAPNEGPLERQSESAELWRLPFPTASSSSPYLVAAVSGAGRDG